MNMHRPQLTHSRQRQAMPGGPSAGRLRVSGHPPGRKSPSLSPLWKALSCGLSTPLLLNTPPQSSPVTG